MEITKRLAERVCETSFSRIPAEVVEYSKSLAISALGAQVAGALHSSGKIMARYVQRMGGNPEATVMGRAGRTSVENAALANATFAHATEYEDDSLPEADSSYTVLAPVFSLGEKLGASGRDVIEAFVVGNEVQSRTGMACLEARRYGHMNLSLSGGLGVAAAAAKLLRLDVYHTTMALSLAASQGSGIVRQSGSMAHYFEMGIAARNGLAAALLAAEGFTGAPDILEAPRGFFDLMTAGKPTAPEDVVNRWGNPWRVLDVGIKKYPCCYHMQRIVESAVLLKKEHGIDAADVAGVEVDVNPMLPQVIRHPEPANAEEAQFSLPQGIAAALLEEEITPHSFSDERVRDEACSDMRRRVKTIVHDEWGWATIGWVPITTIVMKDGRRFSKKLEHARGEPPNLLPFEEVRQKYETCVGSILTRRQVEESTRLVLGLEKLDSIGKLIDSVAFQVE